MMAAIIFAISLLIGAGVVVDTGELSKARKAESHPGFRTCDRHANDGTGCGEYWEGRLY